MVLLQALQAFWRNTAAFWQTTFDQWASWLARLFRNAPIVNQFFFDAFWEQFQAIRNPDINWTIFWDFTWQDLAVGWTAFQQFRRALFDFLWISFSALLPSVDTLWNDFLAILQRDDAPAYLTVIVRFIAIYFVLRLVRPIVNRLFARGTTPQQRMLLRRGIQATIIVLFLLSSLELLNIEPGVFFGAAGVLTLAIGFAAQTSVSNLISGLFLIMERAIELENLIEVDGTTGFVNSIGLVSTQIRTFQNLLVRIPNETMVKAKITNYSRLPIRRIDIKIGIAYKEDIARVRTILFDLAEADPLVLEEPQPLFIFLGFGNSSLDLQLSVWTLGANFLSVLNGMHIAIKTAFDEHGIEIPFPHLTLYTGAETEPFPLSMTEQLFQQKEDAPAELEQTQPEEPENTPSQPSSQPLTPRPSENASS
jgi:small-conductance mechanosensitive channel